jgi:hypothetical protein
MDSTAAQIADPLAAHQRRLADVRRQRRRALGLVVLSLLVGLFVPEFFVQLIARAQEACLGNLGVGGRIALFDLEVALALVSTLAFLFSCLAARKLPVAARTAVGLAVVLVICVAATRQSVPIGNAADYPMTGAGACGPGGVPLWWPAVLSHG